HRGEVAPGSGPSVGWPGRVGRLREARPGCILGPFPMSTRRAFLGRAAALGTAATSFLTFEGSARIARAASLVSHASDDQAASDEDFWREVQLGFTLDRSIINLNNGGVSPSPRV